MKKNRFLLLVLLFQAGLGAYAQFVNSETNGIHVNGGHSDSIHVSSNIGTDCYATGDNSFAGGCESQATGSCSFAFGYQSYAVPLHAGSAVALGRRCQAKETCSYAIGDNVIADGSQTFGIGFNIKTYHQNSIVIGMGDSMYDTLISQAPGITMGMGSTMPTLFVSKGSLFQTGRVAIGNTYNPQAKLHIRSDVGEDAGLFLEPTGKNGEISFIRMTDESHQIAVDSEGKMLISSEGNGLAVSSANANLTGTELVLGSQPTPRINLTADDSPAIYSNAHRSGNSCRRYMRGSSFAVEFANDAMLFRTAEFQDHMQYDITNWRDALTMKTDGTVTLRGKVGVNRENTTAGYALAVDGGLITTKVYIQDVEDWPDYVFDETYRLMPLRQLKRYVADNRHLPGMPSQAEVEGNGYDLNAMQQAMLKTIEELTLYTLQQQEEIDALKKMVEELKRK